MNVTNSIEEPVWKYDEPGWGEQLADAREPGHARSSSEVVLELLQRDRKAADREAARAGGK